MTQEADMAPRKSTGSGNTPNTLDAPEAAKKAEEKASKRADEVKDLQVDVHHDNVTNVPDEPVVTAYGEKPKSDKPVAVSYALVGQEVLMYVGEREVARFGREDWLGHIRKVNAVGSSL